LTLPSADAGLGWVTLFVALFGLLFASGMLANQVYGLHTGVGTVDR
jgi:hypothetical protein